MRALIFTVLLLAAPAAAQEPLQKLAARVPAGTEGMIVLNDVSASAAEIAPLTDGMSEPDRRMMPFTTLTLIGGFDVSSAFMNLVKDGLASKLGFRLDEIGQIASWNDGQDRPVVVTRVAARQDAIAEALVAQGYARTDRNGTPVWSIQDDFALDQARSAIDPFAQFQGHSGRIAFDRGHLLFARSWAGIDALLTGGAGLDSDKDAAAILAAGYGVAGRGRLLEAILLGSQGTRADAVRHFIGTGPGAAARIDEILKSPGYGVDPFPPFERHGLLMWQDGRRISGALAIAYPDRATAVAGVMAFGPVSMSIESLFAKAPFARLFPYARWTGVIETQDRAVALIGFEQVVDAPASPMMFIINPYDRLRDMLMTGDLSLLVAR